LLVKTAKYYGVILEGTLEQCEGCGLAMAKQKALNKQTSWKAKAPYERIFVDASGPHPETMGGNKYWFQAVDDFSRFGWCTFAKKKNEMLKFVESIFKEAKSAGYVMKCLRADGCGENDVPLKNLRLTWDKDINVHYEGTSPYTPQQNGVVEQRIALLRDRAHAQFLTAGLKPSIINLLWAQAINKVNMDENVTCTSMTPKRAYEILRGHRPQILPYLIQLGRIGVVTNRCSFTGKCKEHGEKQIVIGYGEDQESRDTYKFLHPVTKAIRTSRDMTWLPFVKLDPKRDMRSVFAKDPELIELPIGLDDNEPFYSTPLATPAPSVPHLIADDAATNFEAGRMLEQDASTEETTNDQVVSDDKSSQDVQRQAVEKAVIKSRCLETAL
jgi:hypothetical protein